MVASAASAAAAEGTLTQQQQQQHVYTTSLELLKKLSIQDQSLVWIQVERDHEDTVETMARLCLREDNNNNCTITDDSIQLSPLIAANLSWNHPLQQQQQHQQETVRCFLQPCATEDRPQEAAQALLRPIGMPPITATNEERSWTLPPPQSLLLPGQLIAAQDSSSEQPSSFHHYQVVSATTAKQQEQDHHQQQTSCYIVTAATTLEIDIRPHALSEPIPRLPMVPLDQLPPHPNLSQLAAALFSISPTSCPTQRILHVLGTPWEHHVHVAVQAAAHACGYRYHRVQGLAAYAHAAATAGRTLGRQPGADALAGLDAALQRVATPGVLHLVDIDDDELDRHDEPLRHDQEARLWNRLVQQLAGRCVTSRRRQNATMEDDSAARTTTSCPSLVVVLSTRAPLLPGPLLEGILGPWIVLDTPDRDYAQYLWTQHMPLPPHHREDLLALWEGRSARDIEWLGKECRGGTNTDVVARAKDVCRRLDETRRREASASVAMEVHWKDVGGLAQVRAELLDALELPLQQPHLFPKGAGRSGILFYGPPGTGKTLVGKAVATECDLPFLSVKGPELLGSYVGESEANVRSIFRVARKAAKANKARKAAILFFDELDSIAPRRGGVGDGGGVMERVVATLFAELDGDAATAKDGRVFVLGATNRPDLLDPSLLRPGRLDRLVYLGIPTDPEERAKVLAAQIGKLRLNGDAMEMARRVVAQLPERLTGADMSTIASGAMMLAVERLCDMADRERNEMEISLGESVTIEDVLKNWSDDKLTATVELDDLLAAAADVVPSVSAEDLDRYERLRAQYSNSSGYDTLAG